MNQTRAVSLVCTLLLALTLGVTAALAQSPAQPAGPAAPPVPTAPPTEPGLCTPPAPAAGAEPAPFLSLSEPDPTWRSCRFFCETTRCNSSNQCTAAPGGVCLPVCNSGCCSYP